MRVGGVWERREQRAGVAIISQSGTELYEKRRTQSGLLHVHSDIVLDNGVELRTLGTLWR